jgi:hypothetical protein
MTAWALKAWIPVKKIKKAPKAAVAAVEEPTADAAAVQEHVEEN